MKRNPGGREYGRELAARDRRADGSPALWARESLFNILAHKDDFSFEGARVIDLFAGSGALGFEAVSRGAAFCLFIETDAEARGAIRANIEAFQLLETQG